MSVFAWKTSAPVTGLLTVRSEIQGLGIGRLTILNMWFSWLGRCPAKSWGLELCPTIRRYFLGEWLDNLGHRIASSQHLIVARRTVTLQQESNRQSCKHRANLGNDRFARKLGLNGRFSPGACSAFLPSKPDPPTTDRCMRGFMGSSNHSCLHACSTITSGGGAPDV